jgi:hypothetical protein
MRLQLPTRVSHELLVPLVYELLDAHDDTARIAGETPLDPAWRAHLEYLRALQRKGRELLAQTTLEPSS